MPEWLDLLRDQCRGQSAICFQSANADSSAGHAGDRLAGWRAEDGLLAGRRFVLPDRSSDQQSAHHKYGHGYLHRSGGDHYRRRCRWRHRVRLHRNAVRVQQHRQSIHDSARRWRSDSSRQRCSHRPDGLGYRTRIYGYQWDSRADQRLARVLFGQHRYQSSISYIAQLSAGRHCHWRPCKHQRCQSGSFDHEDRQRQQRRIGCCNSCGLHDRRDQQQRI